MGCTSSSSNNRHGCRRKSFPHIRHGKRKDAFSAAGDRIAPFSLERPRNHIRSWSLDDISGSLYDEALLGLHSYQHCSVSDNDFDEIPWAASRKWQDQHLSNCKQYKSEQEEGEDEEEEEEDEEVKQDEREEGAGNEREGAGKEVEEVNEEEEDQAVKEDEGEGVAMSEVEQPQEDQPWCIPFLVDLAKGSPCKLCPEQERRLRRINLEVPAGLADLNSDASGDENEGFNFAKLDRSYSSFGSEQGEITVITPASSGFSEVISTVTSFSEICEKVCYCSISEPEFEVLISLSYPNFHLEDSDCYALSPDSAISSDVSPCTPVLERFPSNSVGQSFDSEKSYMTGSRASFGDGSISPCSPSLSESIPGYLPQDAWSRFASTDSVPCEEFPITPLNLEWNSSTRATNWDQPYPYDPSNCQWNWFSSSESLCTEETTQSGVLIPGLPNDLAQLCLMRVSFIKYDPRFRMVSRQWRAVLTSEEFYKARKTLGIKEAFISLVVHGNKVHIFSLQSCRWFCLPPLPRSNDHLSFCQSISPEWDSVLENQLLPKSEMVCDWGIDPYDWWQIDTVTASQGTPFVIGGGKTDINSFISPNKCTNRVHKFDFCRNDWIAVAPMQVSRSHAAAISLDRLIYVAGGSENREDGASVEVYNPELDKWCIISSMNTSMRACVGIEHSGHFFVKGEGTAPGNYVDGEILDVARGTWQRMSPGMRRGLERGPMTSCNSNLFVADWKDNLLKVYDSQQDSWSVVTKLPARISRLVGHFNHLYALSGRVKIDSYKHRSISDAPTGVWRLNLRKCSRHFVVPDLEASCQVEKAFVLVENEFSNGDSDNLLPPSACDCNWECLWWNSKPTVKTRGLAWVPSIAHCTLFED